MSLYLRVTDRDSFRYSAGAKLSGVIYVHRISDDKFGGLAVKNLGNSAVRKC